MLCQDCALMFEGIEGKVRDPEEGDTDGFKDHTSLEDLLRAKADDCYICSNIFHQLEDEKALGQLKVEVPPLLLRRGWRNSSTNEMGASLLRNIPLDNVPVGVKRWHYRLTPVSTRDDRFGFDFQPTKSGDLRAIHRLHHQIPSTTGSPEVAALARQWYEGCRANHVNCRDTLPWASEGTTMSDGVRLAPAIPGADAVYRWYPPRLLDISSNTIRLLPRERIKGCPAFAALSHCWGRTEFMTLTTSNIEDFESAGVDLAVMPENFRNVIDICRWLGISFVWIDSFCIIQKGTRAKLDWNSHIDSMRFIYSSCDVCISTAATDGATKTCFKKRDPATIAPVSVVVEGEPHLLIGMDHATRGFRNAPIASRAWVLQERLLSRRILTMGPKQIFWECCETERMNVCETFPQGLPPYGYSRGPFSLPQSVSLATSGSRSTKDQRTWLNLIETYCECQLTNCHEDKLVAFAGIAQHFQGVFGSSPYIAGFFAFELPVALLWYVRWKAEPKSRPKPSTNFYRSPSWSWAATDSLIRFRQTYLDTAELEPPQSNTYFTTLIAYLIPPPSQEYPLGRLSYVELTLRAPLTALRWSGDFPINDYDRADFRYDMPGTEEYMGRGVSVYFDSLDDFNASQEGVLLMPIAGSKAYGQVEGLVIRPARRPQPKPAWVTTEFDMDQACYMRIGMAILESGDYVDSFKAMEMMEFVLL